MEKSRVLIVASNNLEKSGVPNVIMSIVNGLSNRFVFDIVVNSNDGYYKNDFLSYGGKIFIIKDKKHSIKLFSKILQRRLIRKELKCVFNLNQYSVIHVFKEIESGLYLKIAKKHKIPIRIAQSSRVFSKPSNFIKKLIIFYKKKLILKNATNLLAVSNEAGQSLYGWRNFEVIYNTYDMSSYRFVKNTNDKFHLVQIGTIMPLKNQLFSIKVLNNIIKKQFDCSLCILGKVFDTKYYNECLEFINDNNLNNYVSFKNQEANQFDEYSKATASLLPSLSEGFCLVAIESQACGVQCFASLAIPRIVNVGGIHYNDLNPEIWADKIIDHYTKNNNLHIKYDLSCFHPKNILSKYQNIYSKN